MLINYIIGLLQWLDFFVAFIFYAIFVIFFYLQTEE